MDNASKNAGDMIGALTLQYNRGRQAAITNELVDIITGSSFSLFSLSLVNFFFAVLIVPNQIKLYRCERIVNPRLFFFLQTKLESGK